MLPLAHSSFGINTNIFETNLINLTAVVGIVITFAGNNLNSLLENRKNTIVSNLEEANRRAIEAQQKLQNAKNQLELSRQNAENIRQEGINRVTNEIQIVVNQHKIRLTSLEQLRNETIQFYQQKAFKEAYFYVVSRIINRVQERLANGLDSSNHVIVNNFYVSKLTAYNP